MRCVALALMALIIPLSTLQAASPPDYIILPEEVLWENLRQGEESALAALHKNYYQPLFRYGQRVTQNAVITEDCIQDLFATLWASRHQVSPVQSVKFYLFSSYRRLVLQHLKKQQLLLTYIFPSEPNIVFSAEELLLRTEADQQTAQNLIVLLNSLPKRQKEALYLKYYENLHFEEVAQVMNLNYQSVLNHIHRALNNIRRHPDLAVLLGRACRKPVRSY